MSSNSIDFYFDFVSPYSYIAAEVIDGVAAKHGRKVRWHPMLLGVVFQKTGQQPLVNVPLKGEYSLHDFARSARYHGVPFRYPEKFPVSPVTAARAFYWLLEEDCAKARAFAHAIFRAYWVSNLDISDLAVVQDVAAALGIDADALAAAIAQPGIKERLRAQTQAAIASGMCGAPWFLVDNEPFWGLDRLPQIEKWLQDGGF